MTEYGIIFHRKNGETPLHRGPWTLKECEDWLFEADYEFPPGTFSIVSREVTEWKELDK